MEAWVKGAPRFISEQSRIVTLSPNPRRRNVTLEQGFGQLSARIRTRATSVNGSPGLKTTADLSKTNLTHLVVTREETGRTRVYMDRKVVATRDQNGDLSNWNLNYPLVLANELTQDRGWLGELHLVALYDRALTEADVHTHFKIGTQRSSAPVGSNQLTIFTRRVDLESNLVTGLDGTNNVVALFLDADVKSLQGYLGVHEQAHANHGIVFGQGARWNNEHELYVGFRGSGNRLMVSHGGELSNKEWCCGNVAGREQQHD